MYTSLTISRTFLGRILLTVQLFLIIAIFPPSVYAQSDKLDTALLEKICHEVMDKYLDEVSEGDLVKWGIDGILSHLDPYTDYYTLDRLDQLHSITTGEYEGVGLYLDIQDDKVVVTQPIENSPATRAGIMPGDVIIAIDDQKIAGYNLKQTSALVRGEKGSLVILEIERTGESHTLTFEVIREKIEIKDIPFSGIISEGIGYIRLMHFSQKAVGEVEKALVDFRKRRISRIILDLRDNPGGLLSTAVGVTDLFAEKGDLIVSTKGRKNAYTNKHLARRRPIIQNASLLVLVNKSSASAAEIVAGAIQDLDLGLVVGQRTFGKGLVQTVLYPSGIMAMKMTTARYFTPSGRSIQGKEYHRDGSELTSTEIMPGNGVFQTAAGRPVFEDGGILPDIELKAPEWSDQVNYLNKRSMFLKFAVNYVASNNSLPIIVETTDEIKSEFRAFLEKQNFNYLEEESEKVSELIEMAEKSKMDDRILSLLREIQNHYKNPKNELNLSDPGIDYFLEREINWVHNGERGRIAATFDNDSEIQEAILMLSDRDTYRRNLQNETITKRSEIEKR